jgi:MFS family permease
LVLVGFFLWEDRISGRTGGQPLVDPALFRSSSFTWGVILAALGVLSMISVLFTMPQYFQGVLGTDAMGAGLGLLPLIAGFVAGAIPADRMAARIGPKITVMLGFALLTVGLSIGALTSDTSGEVFLSAWMAIVGAGMGLSMATAASAALSALPEGQSGIGSAVMQALQKVGGPFGAALLGSILNSAYGAHLQLSGIPAPAARVAKESVFGGVVVARQIHSTALLHTVRAAFVDGMDLALVVSAGVAVSGIALTLLMFPQRVTVSRRMVKAA